MKFARYLEDTQVPEWERAYIDYRGLKKRIKQVVRDQPRNSVSSLWAEPTRPSIAVSINSNSPYINAITRQSPNINKPTPTSPFNHRVSISTSNVNTTPSGSRPAQSPKVQTTPALGQQYGSFGTTPPVGGPRPPSPPPLDLSPAALELPDAQSTPAPRSPSLRTHRSDNTAPQAQSVRRGPQPRRATFSMKGLRRKESTVPEFIPTSLTDLYLRLKPVELKFFEKLDAELDKVEAFYQEREKEARIRAALLKEQLRELQDHRKAFYEQQTKDGGTPHWTVFWDILKPSGTQGDPTVTPTEAHHPYSNRDPDEYQRAKRRLKKAILEFYRGLELLDNYRILNLTGFRKALKKWEKVTRIPAQQLYLNEKVTGCSFSNDQTLRPMMDNIELLFAARFEGGDRKRARTRLRAHYKSTTHHFSTYRSGMYTGLGIPAFAMGLYQVFQPETQAAIPEWSALLQVYISLFLVVVFIMLIGLNLLVWARSRINFVFIFELDLRSAIDPREFSEFPAFLFFTLAFAFCISFMRIGSHSVAPTTWPLAWIVFALVLTFNPLPFFFKKSRYWLLRIIGRLFVSGYKRVEFADFWMGDQLCSLKYTLANFYFIGCVYSVEWIGAGTHCQMSHRWVAPAFLNALPSIMRLLQCIKRYVDSGVKIHLINGGKYTGNVIVGFLYLYWRYRGSRRDHVFALWCLFATIDSTYTSSWDLLMDWSLLKPHAHFKFLRPTLVYTNAIPTYYFAIISNVVIRFIWVWYLVPGRLNPATRGVIFACLEILRRVQWNFFRLENEHLGNADQYRVTREVPLPYTFGDGHHSDGEEDGNGRPSRKSGLRRRSVRMSTISMASSASLEDS